MLTKIVLLFSISCCNAFNIELDWTYALNNPDYDGQERESYFGYTVGLVATATSAWAVVGAPRANDTQGAPSNVIERGAVYLCPLPATTGPCRQLTVTTAENGSPGGGGNEKYVNLQDHGWLGGSLDLRPERADTVIATCSPRWINQQGVGTGERYFMNGACYLTSIDGLTSSKPWRKVIPLIDRDKQVITENNVGLYYYELGQGGLSAHVTEGNDELWLGAPGIRQWTGSVAKVAKSSVGGVGGARATGDWVYTENKVFAPAAPSLFDDYFGYSVESGRFFGSTTSFVAGSPRHDLHGKVSVFETTAQEQIKVRWEMTGPQLGAYFGAALATGDVNDDGWSELFVGAPLYSSTGLIRESGLVVVYSRKDNLDNLDETGRLVGSGQNGARFGSAVMVVGDLDRDGYKDLAVGAPYDADGTGAVYIYRGSADGLLTTVSQKLAASDVGQNLRGFGISLSRGADVDGNGYTDLAVGAHEGLGSALVFRTRPVLYLSLKVTPEFWILVEAEITFNVVASVHYSGSHILDRTDIIISGIVDSGLSNPRAVFKDSGTAETTLRTTVAKDHDEYITFPIKLKEKIEDYEQPLQISFEAKVNYDDPGCEMCGLTSPASNFRSAVSLSLALGCGAECTPELNLFVSWKGASTLALRSRSTVTLSIVVSVGGKDTSYKGTVTLLLPDGLTAHQPLPYSCTKASEGVLCYLPNPMDVGQKAELEVSVEESGDILEEKDVVLQVTASASGAQEIMEGVTLSLIDDVKLVLNGRAEDDLIQYSEPPTSLAVSSIIYQVINRGASRVNQIRLDINIPVAFEGSTFAKITEQSLTIYGGTTASDCTSELSSPSDALASSPVSEPPYKTSTKLVCSEEPLLTCERITCMVRQVDREPFLTVEVAYNITVLLEKFGNEFTVALYSNAAATYGDPIPKVTAETGIWTTLSPMEWHPSVERTPVWAYAVAVLVGLLILAVIILVLFKIGFFKRKRPVKTSGNVENDAEDHSEGGSEAVPLQGGEGDAMEVTGTTAEVATDANADAD